MIIYGLNPVREAIRSHPERIRFGAIAKGRSGRSQALADEARRQRVSVRFVSQEQLDRMAPRGAVHNGVVADLSDGSYEGFEALLERDPSFVFVLDQITDPQNLGAILRVADAFGVDFIVIPEHDSAGLTSVAIKASAGASEWVPVTRVTNVARSLESLKTAGFWVYGADASGEAIDATDLTGKVAIVLGSEGKGIRRNVLDHCDATIGVPMRGHVDSLNVAASAAVMAWEVTRQRRAAGHTEKGE